jgi:hypothetical protein
MRQFSLKAECGRRFKRNFFNKLFDPVSFCFGTRCKVTSSVFNKTAYLGTFNDFVLDAFFECPLPQPISTPMVTTRQ